MAPSLHHSETMAFSLLGGPLHRIASRVGLVKGENTVRLGLVLGWLTWAILIGLALADDDRGRLWSLPLIGVHVRSLLVIPLLFVAESMWDPHIGVFVRSIEISGLVSGSALLPFHAELERLSRWKDSPIPDGLSLAATLLATITWPHASFYRASGVHEVTVATQWYAIVCLPLFRFLLLRWLFRLGMWWHFLWRLSRLDLRLMASHPDGAAGLVYLEVVQQRLVPLVLALSAAISASLTPDIATGVLVLEKAYPLMMVTVLTVLALALVPLLFFVAKLRACREQGLCDYQQLGQRVATWFDEKWLPPRPAGEAPVDSDDVQALANLSDVVSTISQLRAAVASSRLLVALGIAAAVPMLPLLLFKYPVTTLLEKVFSKLAGG
jgi:hypothetical protein